MGSSAQAQFFCAFQNSSASAQVYTSTGDEPTKETDTAEEEDGETSRRHAIKRNKRSDPTVTREMEKAMQVTRANELKDGRGYISIGRIKASGAWRAGCAVGDQGDRLATVRALIREAQEFDADAIIGLDFEVEAIKQDDFAGDALQRVAASGLAVKFVEAARSLEG